MIFHHEKLKFKLLSMELSQSPSSLSPTSPVTIHLSICHWQQPGALSCCPILMPLLCVSSTRKPSCSSNRDSPTPHCQAPRAAHTPRTRVPPTRLCGPLEQNRRTVFYLSAPPGPNTVPKIRLLTSQKSWG